MTRLPVDLMTLWNSARAMHSAPVAFAPAGWRDQWTAANSVSALEAFTNGVESAKKLETPMEGLATALQGSQLILSERQKIMAEMRNNILLYINSGALVGFGFEAPRRLGDTPHELLPEYWLEKCDWDKGEIAAQSLRFVEVRVLSRTKIEQLLGLNSSKHLPEQIKPKVGRPSVRQDIEDAVRAIIDEGKIDTKASMKSHYPLIRAWLRQNRPASAPTSEKPGNESLRRVFKPHFEKVKKL